MFLITILTHCWNSLRAYLARDLIDEAKITACEARVALLEDQYRVLRENETRNRYTILALREAYYNAKEQHESEQSRMRRRLQAAQFECDLGTRVTRDLQQRLERANRSNDMLNRELDFIRCQFAKYRMNNQ